MDIIVTGGRPPRPTSPNFPDWLWTLTQRCWDPEASRRPQVSEALRVFYDVSVPIPDLYLDRASVDRFLVCSTSTPWKRLIYLSLTTHERVSVVSAIFSDRSEIEVVNCLCGNDAQSFVDAIDEVPP